MNWKIVGIVVVAVLSLIGIGGSGYAVYKFFIDLPLTQSRIQCNSANADESIAGCSALLQSSRAEKSDRIVVYFHRSRAYERKKDFDHAIQDDTQLIQLSPKDAMSYNNRGFDYQRKGDLDHAIADYNQAIQLAPEMNFAWFNLGEAHQLKGDYPGAIDDFSHFIKLQPRNALGWNNRCYYRAIAGQLEDALADCNQSLLLQPDVGATLDSRAFTYLKMKKYDLAIQDYDTAIGKNSPEAPWLYGRGLARRAKHDTAGSEADIAAALKIDPKIAEQFRRYGVS
jgi:tetratricopeptide (TPR) repeat protein